MTQITTITFFRYTKLPDKIRGFAMMQVANQDLRRVKGQSFYKLMGSGKGFGFHPWPDWSVYSLLQVWKSEENAIRFFEDAALMKKFRRHTTEMWTLYMKNITGKGKWSGSNPFQPAPAMEAENKYLVILTRATIKWHKLISFWKYVPESHKTLHENPGLLYAKGLGEVPVLQMATFSLWKNMAALQNFAYQSNEHREAIRKTREINWYKEELFARFQPYLSTGTWGGNHLLPELSEQTSNSGIVAG